MLSVAFIRKNNCGATEDTESPERQSRNQRSDRDTKGRSDRAGDYGGDPGPRMEHGLNTERESALMALEVTEKISSQLHLEGLFGESVFNPCSIRGSPENLVGNERFLLIVVRIFFEPTAMKKGTRRGGISRPSVSVKSWPSVVFSDFSSRG